MFLVSNLQLMVKLKVFGDKIRYTCKQMAEKNVKAVTRESSAS